MIPVLMFLLPIMAGSSLVDKGLPDLVGVTAAVEAGWAFFGSCFCSVWVGVVDVGSVVFGLEGCPITDVVCAATALVNSEVPKTRAVMAREKLFIAKNLQNSNGGRVEGNLRGSLLLTAGFSSKWRCENVQSRIDLRVGVQVEGFRLFQARSL